MITIAIFYYLYLAVVLFFIIYSFFNIYHLIRFGFASLVNLIIITAYIVIATGLIILSLNFLATIDWSIPLINLSINSLNNTNINF